MTWLDKPFFDLLAQINSLFAYFMRIAWAIAGVLLTINLGLLWIKFALTHTGLKEELIRTTTACILFFIIISSYPAIIMGLNSLVYKIAMASTYTNTVKAMIDKTQDDSGFWEKKGDKADASYSDIVGKIESIGEGGEVSEQYVLDLYLDETGYFSPNAVMRIITLIIENIWYRVNVMEKSWIGLPVDLFGAFMLILSMLAVLLCGILGAAQYFIAALEFSFISAVGVIVLPGMLWNGTKFMSEKLFGAIFGFFLKMLFVSIALMLMFTGFLAMATKEFSGSIDQLIYMIFTSILYMMICQSGPQLAVSMLTGTPQMSLMEAVKAGAAYGGAAVLGAKATQKTAQATAVHGGGFLAQTAGAIAEGAKRGNSLAGGGVKGKIAGAVGVVAGVTGSALKTGGDIARSGGHSLLHGGGGKGSTFSGSSGAGTNRFSQKEKFNTPNQDKTAKTLGEFYKERFQDGKNLFATSSNDDTRTAPTENSVDSKQRALSQEHTPLALSSSSAQQALPQGYIPLALPPPSSTPSTFSSQQKGDK